LTQPPLLSYVNGEVMTVNEAKASVGGELARIERQNPDGELRPWMRDACSAASEHWGLVQQRIALDGSSPQGRACCRDLGLDAPERSCAQKQALAAARAAA
jgi:hypothetical protein